MNPRPVFLLAALLVNSPLLAEEEGDGFVPLFNGKDLSGWVNVACAPDTWSVVDGMIHCTGKPTGTMVTDRQYENFILELEWRHLVPGGNAGVFAWAESLSAPGTPFLRAIEVQVLDEAYGQSESYTTHGDIFPIHGATMEPFPPSRGQRSFPSESRSKASPEWNHYRITCLNGEIRLAVNGKEVSGGKNCRYRKGYIALESEGGVVDYRNLRIKELPSTNPAPEECAPENEHFLPLYNGLNLDGWKAVEGLTESWMVKDWQLHCAGKKDLPLVTKVNYGDFEMVCYWQLPGKGIGEGGLVLRGVKSGALSISAAGREEGKWHRARVRCVGDALTVSVDGKEMEIAGKTEFAAKTGPVGLWFEGGKATFANVFVREIKDAGN
jgi:hypothetical protein